MMSFVAAASTAVTKLKWAIHFSSEMGPEAGQHWRRQLRCIWGSAGDASGRCENSSWSSDLDFSAPLSSLATPLTFTCSHWVWLHVNASGSANKDSGAAAADDKMAERKLPWLWGNFALVLMGGAAKLLASSLGIRVSGQFDRTLIIPRYLSK